MTVGHDSEKEWFVCCRFYPGIDASQEITLTGLSVMASHERLFKQILHSAAEPRAEASKLALEEGSFTNMFHLMFTFLFLNFYYFYILIFHIFHFVLHQ